MGGMGPFYLADLKCSRQARWRHQVESINGPPIGILEVTGSFLRGDTIKRRRIVLSPGVGRKNREGEGRERRNRSEGVREIPSSDLACPILW